MSIFGALDHFLSLFGPALAVALITASACKLLWRSALRTVAWGRLAGVAAGVNCMVMLGGLVLFGRDGKMATYAAMLLANASALWWVGFGSQRR